MLAVRFFFVSLLMMMAACPSPDQPAPPVDDDDDQGMGGCGGGDGIFVIDDTLLEFGAVGLGGTSAAATLTLSYSADGDFYGETGTLTTTVTGDFLLEGTATSCGPSLAVGSSCTVRVAFAPTALGERTGSVTIRAGEMGVGSLTAQLIGVGVEPGSLDVAPASTNFGEVAEGDISAQHVFTLTNSGSAATGALIVDLGGASSSQFVVDTNACTGISLAADETCEVAVSFRPISTGNHAATLTVDGIGNAVTAALAGTGLSADSVLLNISPSSRNFGDVQLGSASVELGFTVTNSGDTASAPIAPSIEGADGAAFAVTSSTCDLAVLDPVESCDVRVTFSPTNVGGHAATLFVGGVVASLTGTGGGEQFIDINPTGFDFGPVVVAAESATADFTITNQGGGTVSPLFVAIGGTDAAMFSIVADGCTDNALESGTSCVMQIRFVPTDVGDRIAALTATDPITGDALIAALSGVGIIK